ncbi:hypothetical protein [Pseudomonas syringae]|nr:hypothetical protein [Pseudomonas syringae]
MKRIPLRSIDRDDIQHLQDEIDKLQTAQSVMLEANRALELGDELTLIRLGLDPTRIADLEQRHKAGKKGFPDYVIRNLSNTIQHLQEYRRAFSQHRLNKDEQAE